MPVKVIFHFLLHFFVVMIMLWGFDNLAVFQFSKFELIKWIVLFYLRTICLWKETRNVILQNTKQFEQWSHRCARVKQL